MRLRAFLLVLLIAQFTNATEQVPVTNCTGLQNMALNVTADYFLANDIDCTETASWNGGFGFLPVGNAGMPFAGSLNGQHHAIYNLTINRLGLSRMAMFGQTAPSSLIVDVGLVSVNVSGHWYTGGLVGLHRGMIRRCYAQASLFSGGHNIGGLTGSNQGIIEESYALVSLTSTVGTSGGLVGHCGSGGAITNSYALGSVITTSTSVGGLVGLLNGGATISQSYAACLVSGNAAVGGLVGAGDGSNVFQSFWDTEISGQSVSVGGISRTTAQMYQDATFIGWNFTDVWWIDEGNNYPRLRWSLPPLLKNPVRDEAISIDELFTLFFPAVFEDLSKTGLNYTIRLSPDNALPSWLAVDQENKILFGTPQNSDAGDYTIAVTACSANLLCTTDEFTLYARVPIGINNCTVLQTMKDDMYGIYRLTSDIDCSGTASWNNGAGFLPIGTSANRFRGKLDGQDYTIIGLTVNRSSTDYVGVFGYAAASAQIYSVRLAAADVVGKNFMGGLVGLSFGQINHCHVDAHATGELNVGALIGRNADGGLITDSHAGGTVTSTANFVGGLAGWNAIGAIISHCDATVDITTSSGAQTGGLVGHNGGRIEYSHAGGSITNSEHAVGGLVGSNQGGTVVDSYAQTSVSATGNDIGGLIGWNNHIVSHCYAAGLTVGNIGVGGLIGNNIATGVVTESYAEGTVSAPGSTGGGLVGNNQGTVQACYSRGVTSANLVIGGLVATNTGSVTQSYWDIQTSGVATSAGGTSRNTAQMYQQGTFVSWDFGDTWWIAEGIDYPKLRALTPPLLQTPITDQNTFTNTTFSFTVPGNTFFDFTSPVLIFTATQTGSAALPSWLNFTPESQTFSGWPAFSDRGQYTIVVTACDDLNQCTSDSFFLNVNNRLPVLAQALADQRFTAEALFDWQVPAEAFFDLDGDAFTYTAQLSGGGALPVWLSFDGLTGTLSGVIPFTETDTLIIEITAFDGYGGQVSDTFSLLVNLAPQANGIINSQAATVDNAFLYNFPDTLFNEPNGEALIYHAIQTNGNPLPAWLTLDSSFRNFFGTPRDGDEGFLFVFLIASDPYNATASISFGIAISSTSGNNPPLLSVDLLDQTASINTLWTFGVPNNTFNDPDGNTLTYTATLEGGTPLPGWLTFDEDTQTFSGASDAVGAWRITVRVTDGNGGFALDTFTLTMQDTSNRPPEVLNPLPDHKVDVDDSFRYTIPDNTFFDSNGDRLRYTAAQSGNRSLPGWLRFDGATRTFSGKPSNTDTDSFGDRKHKIQVCAHDAQASACTDFVLAVSGASLAQEVFTAFIILGSVASAALGIYGYRGPLWNFFLKGKYLQPEEKITLGQAPLTKEITIPAGEVCKFEIYRNGNLVQLNFPWVQYEHRKAHTLTLAPTEEGDVGEFLFCLYGNHDQIIVAYPVRVQQAGAMEKTAESAGCWARFRGLLGKKDPQAAIEMQPV